MIKKLLVFCFLILSTVLGAQVEIDSPTWETIGNTALTLVNDDEDNGDGIADGAWFVDGQDTAEPQGAQYVFGGTMAQGESMAIETVAYNTNPAFVRIAVELYNIDDDVVLATSGTVGFPANNTAPKTVVLDYTAAATDDGDRLALRYLRVSDFTSFRDFKIDNASFNGNFIPFEEGTTMPISVLELGTDWSPVGNTLLTLVNDDEDNGDGIADGAWFVDGQDTAEPQGAQYVFGGTMTQGEPMAIETVAYNTNPAFVRIAVELYNIDDDVVLATSGTVGFPANNTAPKTVMLDYTAQATDDGDRLALRYLRVSDFTSFRDFKIDNATFNGTFIPFEEEEPLSTLELGTDWSPVGNTLLTLVNDDEDNGDGIADGAWFVDGQDTAEPQGAQYVFEGTMTQGEPMAIETVAYNTNPAFVRIAVELYNIDDDVVLATSGTVGFPANNTEPKTVTLDYTAAATDEGDRLALRYLRVSDFTSFRDFKIDNATFNGTFIPFEEDGNGGNTDSGLTTEGEWIVIGDTSAVVVNNDADNGDGEGDGAFLIDGQSTEEFQGIQFLFEETANEGGTIALDTYVYNLRNTFVRINVELYNVNDDRILSSFFVGLPANNTTPKLATITYTFATEDAGDRIAVRYLRTSVFDTVRDFNIDNLNIDGEFVPMELPLIGPGTLCNDDLVPDLPLIPSNAVIEAEIQQAYDSFSDIYLGVEPPSEEQLQNALAEYDALNIQVNGDEITGNTITSFSQGGFLRTIASHLKFNPNDTLVAQKANNTVRWISLQFCQAILRLNGPMYQYEDFARPTVLLQDFLDEDVQDLFSFNLIAHFTNDGNHYWEPDYDAAFQEANDAINTDLVHNLGNVLMAYSTWQDTPEERYRHMRAFKRFMDRFFNYSYGTANGFKRDGSAYHHWTAYDHYMYTYGTAGEIVFNLDDTSFQIEKENYLRFREAIYAQFITSTSDGNKPISMSGRVINNRKQSLAPRLRQIRSLAIAGGNILGLPTPDPILGGLYNQRIAEPDPDFGFVEATPNKEMRGFYQFNHANLAAYRKKNWLAVSKGFTNYTWGTEIFPNENRYGRYQSYGALEILYPGDEENGLGWDLDTWDWNFNPGATSIVLPWEQLQAERGRIDERQVKRFAGALGLRNRGSAMLSNTHTRFGMFAMDFQELENQGFRDVIGPNTHNGTFTFKKSMFMIDGMIISLGSNINNNDNSNPTITTLYQRLDNKRTGVIVDGSNVTNDTFGEDNNHWAISNYGTGFYVLSESGVLTTRNEDQQTPNHNQINPDFSTNPIRKYHVGYLNHGTTPENASYEYIVLPKTNFWDMKKLDKDVKKGKKPYTVHQQDSIAHILEYGENEIWGYALFNAIDSLEYDGLLRSVSDQSMLMYRVTKRKNDKKSDFSWWGGKQKNKKGNQLKDIRRIRLSIVNPDLGFESRQYTPAIEKTVIVNLKGNWKLKNSTNPNVAIVSANDSGTTLSFTLNDGLPIEVVLRNITNTETNEEDDTDQDLPKVIGPKIYPNPTFGPVKFVFRSGQPLPTVMQVLNMQGEVLDIIKPKAYTNTLNVDLSRYPSGFYFIRLHMKESKHPLVYKIFKY